MGLPSKTIFLFRLVKIYGNYHGTRLALEIMSGKRKNVKLPTLQHSFSMRPTKYDLYSFMEIYMDRAYDFAIPDDMGQPGFIIDAGANIGLTTLFFKGKFPRATIVSLEPEDSNFRVLEENARPYEDIHPLKAGLWHRDAPLRVRDAGYGPRGFIIEETTSDDPDAIQAFGPLSLMRKYNKETIDILKMDIEGSELEIFENNPDAWLKHTRCFVVELHDRMREGTSRALFKAMADKNFVCHQRGDNLIFFNQDTNVGM